MHQSSETIGAMATALAKAQAELTNPEKTLTATIAAGNGERTFRYASLAAGLDLVRKCLGQHQIAVMQTTSVNQGQILLTTLLVHASGEWVSSLWPVCSAAIPSAHVKGAALTYARRYALFTLVGIAGEDDLDAPELVQPPEPPQSELRPARKPSNGSGSLHSPSPPALAPVQSASLRDQLVEEIGAIATADVLALWAHRSLPRDNQGETATTIRMRLLPGVAGRSEGVARATADHPRRRIFSVGYCCGKDARWAVVSGPAKGLVHLRIEGISFAGPSHQRPPDEALHGTSNDTRRDGCGREIRLQPGERLSD